MSAARSYAAVLLTALCCCAGAAVNVESPTLNATKDSCVPMLPMSDPMNVTYECETSQGTVLWQLGDYQMVDRDEFQNDGVLILANMGTSSLTIYPEGVMFLFGRLQSDVISVICLAVVDDVNLGSSPSVLVYADVTPDLPSPDYNVTECHGNGSYTVDISYQPLSSDKNCSDIVNYTITVSSGTVSNCNGPVCMFEPNDDLSVRANVDNTAGYTVTLEVCTDIVCRAVLTPLTNLTCTQPTWGFCNGRPNVSCNFSEGTAIGWSCNFTTNEAGNITVVDVFPNGTTGGQSKVPEFNGTFVCPVPDEKENLALVIGISVAVGVVCLLLGAVIEASITICILKWCRRGKRKDQSRDDDDDKIPMEKA